VQSLEGARDALDRAAEAQERGDLVEAAEELTALGEEMVFANSNIAQDQRILVEEVLSKRADPESRYVLDLIALQNRAAARGRAMLLTETASPDLTVSEAAALYRGAVEFFEASRAAYASVTPPDSWRALHEARMGFLDDSITVHSAIADSLEAGTEPPASLLLDQVALIRRGEELNGEISTALAGYFEDLDT
jgi:hypothetical protein